MGHPGTESVDASRKKHREWGGCRDTETLKLNNTLIMKVSAQPPRNARQLPGNAMGSNNMHAKPTHMTIFLKSPNPSPWLLLKRPTQIKEVADLHQEQKQSHGFGRK